MAEQPTEQRRRDLAIWVSFGTRLRAVLSQLLVGSYRLTLLRHELMTLSFHDEHPLLR